MGKGPGASPPRAGAPGNGDTVSLGAIDNGYAALGLRLVRDMLKKAPLLYSWGHGGSDEDRVNPTGCFPA